MRINSRKYFLEYLKRVLVIVSIQLLSVTSFPQNKNEVALSVQNTPLDMLYPRPYTGKFHVINAFRQVDSIARTTGLSSPFAGIYSKVIAGIELQIQMFDSAAKEFAIKFENSFAGYFLDACYENKNGHLSDSSGWKFLFSHPVTNQCQLVLLGVNAHANGDLWKALVKNFSEKQIRTYKKQLLSFHHSIAKAYYFFFDEEMSRTKYLRYMNPVTKSLYRKFGERMIYRWGARQIDLAILYYKDQPRFQKRFKGIQKRKGKIDQMILKKERYFL